MTESAKHLVDELSRLSTKERAEVAQLLIESLDETADPDAEEAWDAELAQRVADVENGTVTGESASAVFRNLRERFS